MARQRRTISRIGGPPRRHFIGEWMNSREPAVTAADLVREIDVDKSTVSRWLGGQMPQPAQLERLAEFFQVDPESLQRHPDDDWLTRFFAGREAEERERIKQAMELAWPLKSKSRA